MGTVVIIVGDPTLRAQLTEEFEALSIDTQEAGTIRDGLQILGNGGFDLLMTDLQFPDGVGFEILEAARDARTGVTVLVGDNQEVESAEEVLKHGVADFLPTPVDRSRLRSLVEGLRESDELKARISTWGSEVDAGRFGSMVGGSPSMRRVFERLARIGPSSAPVLITGDSGTGKELAARTLHELSRRREGPFVAVNCGAISPTLMESELFGHERGSFTGATRTHRGFFERAHRGTLFLDEITEMPLDLQVKLLRVLETSRVMRIGAEKHRTTEVRVLAATNRSPTEAIDRGKLREDLYYRLKVLHVTLPPLRERVGDIPLLARHFLLEIMEREGQSKTLSEETVKVLEKHAWPGNARELRNAVYTAYLLSEKDEIGPEALPPEIERDGATREGEEPGVRFSVGGTLEDAERRLILTTLAHMDGNKTRAAEVLGISVKTLYNRLHAYGMMDSGEGGGGSIRGDGSAA